jgi:outer membrane protein OmpA-like peptidoglycan-associated protein
MEKHSYKIVYVGDKTNSADSVNFTANQQGSQTTQLKTFFKQHVSKVLVKDAKGMNLSDVRLNLYKHNGTLSKMNTDASGSYAWKNEGSEKVDSIVANFINHDDARVVIPESVSGNCVDTVNYSIVLREKQESEFIRLDLVLYNFDKYFLRPEGKLELDKLVKYMKEHPDLKVELSSHTDSRGSDKYNMKLSKNRAKSCVDYIISQGIAKKLITAQGYGETKLRNNCSNGVKCTKEEHQANRRTELKLITPENNELNNNKLE